MSEKEQLPQAISTYLDASNDKDLEKFLSAFAEDAIVHDEGKVHQGIAAIREWKEALDRQFEIKYEYLDTSAETAGHVLVKIRCTGNFPGSPIVFKQDYTLKDGKIKEIKISE